MGNLELGVYLQKDNQITVLGSVGKREGHKSFSTPIGTFRAGQDQTFEDAFAVEGFHYETGMEQPEQIYECMSLLGVDGIEVGINGTRVIFQLQEHQSRLQEFFSNAGTIFSIRVG